MLDLRRRRPTTQQHHRRSEPPHPSPAVVEVQLCVTDEAAWRIPPRRTAPQFLPVEVPVPRKGEVIFLAPTSPWVVRLVAYQWRSPGYLRIEVWLEPVRSTGRPIDSERLTQ